MALPYTLGIRQQTLYTERVDLYRPVITNDSSNQYELAYSNIPAQIKPTDNFDTLQGATRLKQNNIQTSDSIHVHVDQEIGSEWAIFVRPESVRYQNVWFVTLGEKEEHGYRAKYARLYVNQTMGLDPAQII